MEVKNNTPEVAELLQKQDFIFYEDLLTIDYKELKKGEKKTVNLQISEIPEGDKVVHLVVSCGCTQPKIFGIDDTTQLIEVNFKPNSKGYFTKQITLYNKDKTKKQLIKLTGNAV